MNVTEMQPRFDVLQTCIDEMLDEWAWSDYAEMELQTWIDHCHILLTL